LKTENSVLLIFAGGTISMSEDQSTGSLRPLNFDRLQEYMPELKQTGCMIKCIPLYPLIDSSDVDILVWERLASTIEEHYDDYDGFVVLHGTDTMAYSASALSFMLENLAKPVIFTGSQLPIGMLRSDAKENLLTAIEIASAKENGQAIVPEVCIFFEDSLFRGNRATKRNAEHFNAFNSYNFPPLAKAGVHIKYFPSNIKYPTAGTTLNVHKTLNPNIVILKLFPSIPLEVVKAIIKIPKLRAVVIETYGAGNAPRQKWLFNLLKSAEIKGILVVNKTQCSTGMVDMGRYETSLNLMNAGVMSAHDCTTEAIVTKLMYLFDKYSSLDEIKCKINSSICGEMTIS
jgi:L-asparaginase